MKPESEDKITAGNLANELNWKFDTFLKKAHQRGIFVKNDSDLLESSQADLMRDTRTYSKRSIKNYMDGVESKYILNKKRESVPVKSTTSHRTPPKASDYGKEANVIASSLNNNNYDSLKNTINNLTKLVNRQTNKISILDKKINNHIAKVESNPKSTDNTSQRFGSFEKTINSINVRVNEISHLLNTNISDVKQIRLEFEQLASSISEIRKKLKSQEKIRTRSEERVNQKLHDLSLESQEVNREIERLSERMLWAEKSVTEINNLVKNYEPPKLQGLRDELLSLREDLDYLKLPSPKWSKHSDRIKKVIKASKASSTQLPEMATALTVKKDFLREINLSYSADTISEVITGLRRGHVLLFGPPGVGKTSFLKNISRIFVKSNDIAVGYHPINSDMTSYDILGGKTIVDRSLIIKFGIFTEAVITCIETKRTTILVFDDITSSHPDDMLSGLLDALHPGQQSVLKFDDLSLMTGSSDNEIVMPQNFRLICSANNPDPNFLNRVSDHVLRRFTPIHINTVDPDEEHQILMRLINAKSGGSFSVLRRFRLSGRSKRAEKLISVIRYIRKIEGELEERDTFFGISYTTEAVKAVLKSELPENSVLDNAFRTWILKLLLDFPEIERKKIADKLFQNEMQKSASMLQAGSRTGVFF